MIYLILILSILLQLGGIYIALKSIKNGKQHLAWILIAGALSLTSTRRAMALYNVIINTHEVIHYWQELIALLISAFLFVAIYKIHPYLEKLIASQSNLEKVNKQLSEEIKSHGVTDKKLIQFKTTLDQTLDSVFMFHPKSLKFFYANQGAINLLGFSAKELELMTPLDIKPEFDNASFRLLLKPMIEGKKESITFRTLHLHKSGKKIPVEIFLQLVKSSDSNSRFVAIVRDIVNQVKIENELRLINHELETFIYRASHDLRGPIATSRGLIDLSFYNNDKDEQQKLIRLLSQTNDKLGRTLDDLLVVIKLKRRTVKLSNIKFKKLITKSLLKVSAIEGFLSLNITLNIDTIHKFYSDKFVIRSIIENVLNNSIYYRNKEIGNPSLYIKVSQKNDGVELVIEDNGIGIREEELSKVFNLFHRASTKSGGSGMGLFIVKLSVKKVKAEISLISQEYKGTKCTIWLPNLNSTVEYSEDNVLTDFSDLSTSLHRSN